MFDFSPLSDVLFSIYTGKISVKNFYNILNLHSKIKAKALFRLLFLFFL